MRYYLVYCPRTHAGTLLWASGPESAGRAGRRTGLFPRSRVLYAVWLDRPGKSKLFDSKYDGSRQREANSKGRGVAKKRG